MSSGSYVRPRHLPLGVAILAVLIAIFGVLYFIFGALLLIGIAVLGVAVPHFVGIGAFGGLLLLVVGLVLLLVARGLWDLELWALVLSILVVGGLWLSNALAGYPFSLGSIILLILLIYLVAVHAEFR